MIEGGDKKWLKKAELKKAELKKAWLKKAWLKKAELKKAAEPAAAASIDTPIGTAASRRLCEDIADMTGGRCFLGFSRGKDSIAAWLYLRQFFNDIIPFHCASVPHLSFVDESLSYYEEIFGTKILRFLSGEISNAVSNLIFQPIEDEKIIDAMGLLDYGMHDIVDLLRDIYGKDIWCAYGINATDSIDRHLYVLQLQGRNIPKKSFYPCFDWTKKQILNIIDSEHISLPPDYKLTNRTMTGIPNVRHLMHMDEVFPEDMKRIELLFPFIRARLARNEFRLQRFQASREQERD